MARYQARLAQQNRKWWTRARVLIGLKQFWIDFEQAPTNDREFNKLKRFTGEARADPMVRQGWRQKYPTAKSIWEYFPTLREAWEAVAAAHPELKIKILDTPHDWTELEEWFVVEAVGLIRRPEIARIVGHSEGAVKRRLAELGINANNRWGWTIARTERVLGVSAAVIKGYMSHGVLPFYRGYRCTYVEPADLVCIQEYDWAKAEHPQELEDAVRKSLMQRLCFTLMRFDWRRYSYHQAEKRKEYFKGRIKYRRPNPPPSVPKPAEFAVGDWVSVEASSLHWKPCLGRVGQVKSLYWSPQNRTIDGELWPPCWKATVDFPIAGENDKTLRPRTNYVVPVSLLRKGKAPASNKRPVTQISRDRVKRNARMKATREHVLSNRLRVPGAAVPVAT